MKRILYVPVIFFLLSACTSNQSEEKPNIILFFVDDLGWADLGYRNPVFETPNIDKLCSESMEFTQAYIPSPTCSPSRATLLTGLHPARLKLVRHIPHGPDSGSDKYGRHTQKENYWPKDPVQFPCVNWLDLDYTTYAEVLADLGYFNLFVGKWHLGHEPYYPIHQGFNEQIGVTNWGNPQSYYPPYFKNSSVFAEESEKYLTDKLTDEVVRFIEQYDENSPFMLSFWYYNVHSPHQGRKDLVAHFEDQGLEGKMAQYAAMIKSVDESVGRIRSAIHQKGIEKQTILIFLSDQGSYFETKQLHGGKRFDALFEGGARVPLIVNWPGVTIEGSKNKSIVQSSDLFPTIIEMAGGSTEDLGILDGISLLKTIRTNEILQREEPIFAYRAYEDLYASVRLGDWKLLAYRSGIFKLFNISEDVHEKNDLSDIETDKTRMLKKYLYDWELEMGVEEFSGVK